MTSKDKQQQKQQWVAAVEGGGTSFKVAIGRIDSYHEPPTIVHRTQISSRQPSETLDACAAFLRQHKPTHGYTALGIATFGPVGVKLEDPATYGRILPQSPKAEWRNVDFLTPLQTACQGGSEPLYVQVETDVNAPAMAEMEWYHQHHHNKRISSVAYITVGTGVGVGLVVNGTTVHGIMHPEGGHVPICPLPNDIFSGYSWGRREGSSCPFHGHTTVEGMASSIALVERYAQHNGVAVDTLDSETLLPSLSDDDPIWDHAVNALANLCVTLLLTLSIERIVLGGGIMQRPSLLAHIQQQTKVLLNGYLVLPDLADVIVTSAYGGDAGLVGALVLAQRLVQQHRKDETPSAANRPGALDSALLQRDAFGWGIAHGIAVGALAVVLYGKYAGLWGTSRR
jgi:fructokinase